MFASVSNAVLHDDRLRIAACLAVLCGSGAHAMPVGRELGLPAATAPAIQRAAQQKPEVVFLHGTVDRVDPASRRIRISGLAGAEAFWANEAAGLPASSSLDLGEVALHQPATLTLRPAASGGFIVTAIKQAPQAMTAR